VQVDPIKSTLKPLGTKRLKLECDVMLSTSGFKFNLRRYSTAFVKNLPFKCTEGELGAFFDARGGTVTARIVRDKATVGTHELCSHI
jgi:RNA recognition motif-containing protein